MQASTAPCVAAQGAFGSHAAPGEAFAAHTGRANRFPPRFSSPGIHDRRRHIQRAERARSHRATGVEKGRQGQNSSAFYSGAFKDVFPFSSLPPWQNRHSAPWGGRVRESCRGEVVKSRSWEGNHRRSSSRGELGKGGWRTRDWNRCFAGSQQPPSTPPLRAAPRFSGTSSIKRSEKTFRFQPNRRMNIPNLIRARQIADIGAPFALQRRVKRVASHLRSPQQKLATVSNG